METPRRTLAKAITWQTLGLFTMTVIGFIFTGSVSAGGSLAIASALTGVVCYMIHERVWTRVSWGRLDRS